MTTQIDSSLTKVKTFEIGKTYGGYTVEARTACFVTFQGQKRRKVEICDGVESVHLVYLADGASCCTVVDIDAIEDMPEAPSDIEIYNPVTTSDDSIVITDGSTDLKLMSINTNDNIVALVPVNAAKDPDGRAVKVLQLPVLQAIIAKSPVTSAEIESSVTPLSNTVLVIPKIEDQSDNFWQKHQAAIVPNFNAATVADYKAKTDTAFVAGQTYEAPNGNTYTVTNRLGDSLELKNECGYIATRIVHRDSNGEYVRPELNSNTLYAADTPSWFYPVVKPVWYSLADIEETRAQIRRELEQDSSSLIEDRDADKAANFSMRGLV